MPAGLRVWNADGTLQFDTGTRLYRHMTVSLLQTVNGSVVVPNTGGGTIVALAIPTGAVGTPPGVTVSGNTVTWDYGGAGTRRSVDIVIGVY